jgi:hypothetical protein
VPWLRVDDTALVHPKVMRLRTLEDDVVTAERVVGWVMLCATWSGQQLTDCWLPESVGAIASPTAWRQLSAAAVKVRMLKRQRRDGQNGWLVVIDDELFHLMSREEVEKNRERRRSTRQDGPRIDVLLRDGDQCRYCYKTVNPKDNRGKSGRGREFDHPDPDDRDRFVVACTDCNGRKWQRTPEQADMELLPPPDPADRYFHPSTLEWLRKRNVDPWRPGNQPDTAPSDARADSQPAAAPQARPGQRPDTAAPRPGSQPDTAPSEREPHGHRSTAATDRPTDHHDRPTGPPAEARPPGRVGSVQVAPQVRDDARTRDGPRRGRRGRRARLARDPPT